MAIIDLKNILNNIKISGKKVHFIGIGGIGMSALAFVLRQHNINVQGSDLGTNYLTKKLQEADVNYIIGHSKININSDLGLIVKTSIIRDDNPEIIEAKSQNIPIVTRANLLAALMSDKIGITIAGTHGKTSTTAMVSVILEFANLDPTFINGGIVNYFNSNQKIGNGKYMIAESDESDASFVELPTKIGIITNIEAEHLDFVGYNGSFEKQKSYFYQYLDNIPESSICALSIDDPECYNLYQKYPNKNKIISYSIEPNSNNAKFAKITAHNISISNKGTEFSVKFIDGREITKIYMPIYGLHNVSNALAAIAIADFLNIPFAKIIEALENFNGVKRRFTKVGEYKGAVFIDDYGHHPTEIKATLAAAKRIVNGKLISIFEPHKYTRLRDLFTEFCSAFFDADIVIVSDIYSANQKPIENINQDAIISGIAKVNKKSQVIKLNNVDDLPEILKPIIADGDMVLFTGAGKITYWAAKIEEQLRDIDKNV
jgi:UDP-N-acetylmuramate--alanine ligase